MPGFPSGGSRGSGDADRLLLGAAAVVGLVVLGCAFDVGGLSAQALVAWSVIAVAQAAMGVFAARAARTLGRTNTAWRFWVGYAAAGFVYALGDVGQLVGALGDPSAPSSLRGTDLRTACLGIGTAIVVAVMLGYPLGVRSTRGRVRLWLDLATVLVGGASFGIFWAGPDGPAGAVTAWDAFAVLSGPVPALIAVFAVAKLLVAGRPPFTWQTGVLGATAAALEGLSRGVGPTLIQVGEARWFLAATVTAHALLMASARVQQRQLAANPLVLREGRRWSYSPLPYVAIAATYAFLGLSLATGGATVRSWLLFGAAAACTALVVARQLTALADNARLLVQLDLKVRELNRAEGVLRHALAERDELAGQVRELAFSDSVTGLANRAMFTVRLEEAWARVRGSGGQLGVMLVQLTDFDAVNDQMGQDAGDLLLRQAGERLLACLRRTDLTARLAGNEFAVLLSRPSLDNLQHVARRITASLAEPYAIWGERVPVSASIGIAVERGQRSDAEQLLRDAGEAVYAARRRGAGTAEIFA